MKKLPVLIDTQLSIEDDQGKVCNISSPDPKELFVQFENAAAFKRSTKKLPVSPWSLFLGKSEVLQALELTQLHLKVAVKEQVFARKAPSKWWQFNFLRLIRFYFFS
ncbi:MAG: hypothetical protein AAGI49_17215 [Bacteroidota bacterium]